MIFSSASLWLKERMLSLSLWLVGFIALLASFLGLRAKWRSDGREQQRNSQMKETLRHVERSNEIKRRVNSMPGDAVERELREKWSRD